MDFPWRTVSHNQRVIPLTGPVWSHRESLRRRVFGMSASMGKYGESVDPHEIWGRLSWWESDRETSAGNVMGMSWWSPLSLTFLLLTSHIPGNQLGFLLNIVFPWGKHRPLGDFRTKFSHLSVASGTRESVISVSGITLAGKSQVVNPKISRCHQARTRPMSFRSFRMGNRYIFHGRIVNGEHVWGLDFFGHFLIRGPEGLQLFARGVLVFSFLLVFELTRSLSLSPWFQVVHSKRV